MVKICRKLKSQGACSDNACHYRHDVQICEDCGVMCTSARIYEAHLQGKRHKRHVSGQAVVHHCSVCSVNVNGPKAWSQHLLTKRHRSQANQQGVPAEVEPEEAVSTSRSDYCALCKVALEPRVRSRHFKSPKHRAKEKYFSYKATLEEAEKNKHGVTVSDGFDFGIIAPADAQKGVAVQFVIQTTVPNSRTRLDSAKLPPTTTSSSYVSVIVFVV